MFLLVKCSKVFFILFVKRSFVFFHWSNVHVYLSLVKCSDVFFIRQVFRGILYLSNVQMYGEKTEEAEELRLDLEDVKEMYKMQIVQLTGQPQPEM